MHNGVAHFCALPRRFFAADRSDAFTGFPPLCSHSISLKSGYDQSDAWPSAGPKWKCVNGPPCARRPQASWRNGARHLYIDLGRQRPSTLLPPPALCPTIKAAHAQGTPDHHDASEWAGRSAWKSTCRRAVVSHDAHPSIDLEGVSMRKPRGWRNRDNASTSASQNAIDPAPVGGIVNVSCADQPAGEGRNRRATCHVTLATRPGPRETSPATARASATTAVISLIARISLERNVPRAHPWMGCSRRPPAILFNRSRFRYAAMRCMYNCPLFSEVAPFRREQLMPFSDAM